MTNRALTDHALVARAVPEHPAANSPGFDDAEYDDHSPAREGQNTLLRR